MKEFQRDDNFLSLKGALGEFSKAVYEMLQTEKCPESIKKLNEWQVEEKIEFFLEERVPEIFAPTMLWDLNDVFSIEILKPHEKEASKMIPKDLRDFLSNASKYYTSEEWRTSTVLSAITAESLLADLYEEEYRRPTPSKATLGELFEFAKKKVEFPQNIAEAIAMTNNARISAVHRSRFGVSDREATNALYGAANFTMWYFARFQRKQ